jgi:cell division septation protein DedD
MRRQQAMEKNKDKVKPSRNREKLIWSGICLGVSFWMFCLGILVGRGTAPVHFDTKALQKELVALKKAAVEKTRKRYPDEKPPLKFYEALKGPPEIPPVPAGGGTAAAADTTKTLKAEDAANPDHAVPKIVQAEKFKKPPRLARRIEKPFQGQGWIIQVAALRAQTDADQMVTRLTRKGFTAYRLMEEIPGKGIWYRVRVGPFRQQPKAQSALKKLRGDHYSPLLIRTENRGESP